MLDRILRARAAEIIEKLGGGSKNTMEIHKPHVRIASENVYMKSCSTYMHGDKKAVVVGMKTSDIRQVRSVLVPKASR